MNRMKRMKRLPELLCTGLAILAIAVGVTIAGTAAGASAADNQNCSVTTPIDQRPDLRRGDNGSCVTVAQGLLANLGLYNDTFIWDFDWSTESAVRQAQHGAGIYENGIIDQETWDMLAKSSPATPQSATRNCDKRHYRTICVIKGNNGSAGVLYAIENGQVIKSFPVRTSDSRYPSANQFENTSEGRLKVISKSTAGDYALYYDDYSNSTDNSNGQQAIRYSPVFQQCGYDGNLRGNQCITDYRGATFGGVDIANRTDAQWLQGWSNVNGNSGTEIVILHDPNATV